MDIETMQELDREAENRINTCREKLSQLESQAYDYSLSLDKMVISVIERELAKDRTLLEINALAEIKEAIESKLEVMRLQEAETNSSRERDKIRKRWERQLEKVNAAASQHERAEALAKLAKVATERRA